MDSERFDAVVKALASSGSRRRLLGGLVAAAVAGLRPSWSAAQEEIAAAGNGGTADASANGGAVATGNLTSGENAGQAIGVGDTVGGVEVDGGASANATSLDVAADGGTAISDASGGDENVAFLCDCPALACRAFLGCETGQCVYEDPIACPTGFVVDEATCTCVPVACPNAAICPGGACGPAGTSCVCTPTTEGDSICTAGGECADLTVCGTSADCPVGLACGRGCCPTPVCVAPCEAGLLAGVRSAGNGGPSFHRP